MAITHATATRNGIADYVVDLIDGGTGNGTLEFQTGATEVATCTFGSPAFDAAGAAGGNADGVATANTITDDTNATGNASPIDSFEIKDGDGNVILSGAVATSGADINLTSLTVSAGETVSVTSLTYTAPV